MKTKAIAHNIMGALSNFAFLFLTGILLLPYYFKFISTAEYGIWLGGISFLSLISVFEANISLILTQQLAKEWVDKELEKFSKYFSSAMIFGISISITIIIVTFIFKDFLTNWVSPNQINKNLYSSSFFLYSISLSLTIVSGYLNSITQVFLKTFWPPIFNLIASVLGIIYTLWAIPMHGVLALAGGNLVKSTTYIILDAVYVYIILKKIKIPFNIDFGYILILMKNIGIPFVSKLAMTLAVSIQNFIIATAVSTTATTIFDITKKLPALTVMIVNMVAVSTFTSFTLFYSENKNNGGVHEYTRYYFSVIRILLIFTLLIIFIIGQDFITLWVGFDKFGGNLLLALICLNLLADQLRMILSQQYYAIGKFNLTSLTDSIFAISFILIALWLVPVFGLNGIVVSGIFANMLYFSVCYRIEKRNCVNMIKYIVNKNLALDVGIAIIMGISTLSILNFYRGNIIVTSSLIILFVFLFVLIFYKKEKKLFSFLKFKFLKSPQL